MIASLAAHVHGAASLAVKVASALSAIRKTLVVE